MNVLHLLSNKWWSGTERYALDLATTLRRRGHHVEVFTRGFEAVYAPFAKEDLWAGKLRLGGWWDVVSRVSLANRLNHLQGRTVVHTYNLNDAAVAVAARRLCRRPEQVRVVLTNRSATPLPDNPSTASLLAMLDAIVFESDQALRAAGKLPSAKRCYVVPASVVAPMRSVTPFEPTVPQIIYARRIAPGKGLEVLIQALGTLKSLDWRLAVCGTGLGRYVMPAVRLARALGINDRIQWLGHVDDIYPEMQKSAIAVVPDTQPSGTRMAVLEALSQGVAVVMSDAGGDDLKVDTQALTFPAGDSAALADALRSLISNAEQRANIATSGYRQFITACDYAKMVDLIEEIYNEC